MHTICSARRCTGTDIISCSVFHKSLDDPNPLVYVALSYVWGSAERNNVILCNGKELKVTANLHSSLLRLRAFGHYCYLWIDGICTDQSHEPHAVQERNAQARPMGEIYSGAEYVIVDLGDCDDGVEDVMRLMEGFQRLVKSDHSDVTLLYRDLPPAEDLS